MVQAAYKLMKLALSVKEAALLGEVLAKPRPVICKERPGEL